jgi:hypothetical protein
VQSRQQETYPNDKRKVIGNGLESWPMPAGTGVGAVFHVDM